MKLLLQQVLINDPRSSFHNTVKDIFLQDGKISKIADHLAEEDAQVLNAPGLVATPGWIDPFVHFNDPGEEFNETLETGAAAAAAGGFTTVLVIPNTKPVIDSKSLVEYITAKADRLPVSVRPLGAISRQVQGRELAEMYDMQSSGAVAFTDGLLPVQSSGLMLKALQYVKPFDGVIIQVPDDSSIAAHGLVHEGIVSTQLGLQAKPAIAEEIMVARDLELLSYTNSRLHFTGISTKKSVDHICRAKANGLRVTCSVTPYHLFFCDEDLLQYDTNLKVNPPLRTREDMLALRAAVLNGDIDCISTHHQPHNFDAKVLEFEYAKYGMIGLESCLPALLTALPELGPEQIANLLSINSRKIFGLAEARLEVGATADISLYQPDRQSVFSKANIYSRSSNSPFLGRSLKGTVFGIIRQRHFLQNKANA